MYRSVVGAVGRDDGLVPVVLWLGKSKKIPPTVVVVGGSPLHNMQCDAHPMREGWLAEETNREEKMFPIEWKRGKIRYGDDDQGTALL